MGRPVTPAATHPAHLVLGLVVWSVWFVALYGGLSVGCAVAPPDAELGPLTWINSVLLVFTLAVTTLLLYWSFHCWRGRAAVRGDLSRQFIAGVGAAVHLGSAVAVLFIGLPAVVLPPCV
jgi:hypothetical protein